jgi:hypothetical protein
MTWARVNELFHRVLALPADQRAGALDAEDPALRAEVESLLVAYEADPVFLENPPPAAAEIMAEALSAPPVLPESIGPYRIIRLLGQGGMGVVYLAEDSRLGRTVALKAIAPRFAGDTARRERLRREARAAASLVHPGIATVFALEEIDGELYIATEHVAGLTLREELGGGRLPMLRVIETALAIARPMAVAHERGLVHRDLKPENVMRTPEGEVKILDFGIAQMRESGDGPSRLTAEGALLGTPAYMSPEQIRGGPVDARSDVFSLGIIAYELATGAHPFEGRTPMVTVARILTAEPSPLGRDGDIGGSEAAWLEPIVRMCLQKDPRERFASAHSLMHAIERARDGLASGRANPRVVGPAPSKSPFWWWQFHQAAASTAYLALLIPLWFEREWIGGVPGLSLFLAALVAALVASALRLHLWFTVRSYPSEWETQRAATGMWIRAGDFALVALLLVAVALTLTTHARMAVLLVAAAVAVGLSSAVIEPATTRASFRDPFGPDGDQSPAPR